MSRRPKARHLVEIPETPAVMQKAIDNFFLVYDKTPTISGLAAHLCFRSRQAMIKFADSDVDADLRRCLVKKAILGVEAVYERRLHTGNPTGAIFALKNFGWRDTQSLDVKGGFVLNIGRKSGRPEKD